MDIGVSCSWYDGGPDDFVERVQKAEEAGFRFFGHGDSPAILRDVFSSLTYASASSNEISLGPVVTNPVTRHPLLIASSMATIDEVSGGRAKLFIATGDSSVFTLGKTPAKLREIETAIETIQTLLQGNATTYEGNEIRLKWLQDRYGTRDIPVYMTAEGPKSQHLAGKVADGVLIGAGLHTELIEDSIERVNDGAREAGRDPDDVDKRVMARSNIGEDRDEAIDEIVSSLASAANHSLRAGFKGKVVPEEYREPIKELLDGYVVYQHNVPGKSPNRELVESLGLKDYLVERYGVVGTPEDCVQKLRRISDIDGVDGVQLVANAHDKIQYLETMGSEVLPEV